MFGLQLQTQHLDSLCQFYSRIFKFPILNTTSTYFRTQIGTTILDFEKIDNIMARHCFRIGIPIVSFNAEMNALSSRVDIGQRRSVFDHRSTLTWYIRDPSDNIIELTAFNRNEMGVVGVVMLVDDLVKVSEQLKHLGLVSMFINPSRCILQNPDDDSQIVLVKALRHDNFSNSVSNITPTIPTLKASINATVCVRDTAHYLYMVKFM